MPVFAVAAIGTALSAGASIYGASQQAGAARDAAAASKKATDQSIAYQRETRDLIRADNAPWQQAGAAALGRLSDPSKVLSNFQASPDYNFRLDQGNKGVVQNAAVNGLLNSGAALKSLAKFNSNLASGEFGDWWNRQAGLANVGQAANSANANAGTNFANSSQNALLQNAQVQGQSSYNAANAMSQGVGGALGAIGSLIGQVPGLFPSAGGGSGWGSSGGKSTVSGWGNG